MNQPEPTAIRLRRSDRIPHGQQLWCRLAAIIAGLVFVAIGLYVSKLPISALLKFEVPVIGVELPLGASIVLLGIASFFRDFQRVVYIGFFYYHFACLYSMFGFLWTTAHIWARPFTGRLSLCLTALTFLVFLRCYSTYARAYKNSLDNSVRTALIEFLDRQGFGPFTTDRATYALENIRPHQYPDFSRVRPTLDATIKIIETVCCYDAPSDLTNPPASRTKNIAERIAVTIDDFRKATKSDHPTVANDGASAYDHFLLFTYLSSMATYASLDFTDSPAVNQARRFCDAAARLEPLALVFQEKERLPVLYSYWNSIGTLRYQEVLFEARTTVDSSVAKKLCEAYEHLEVPVVAPYFCRARALNNCLDVQVRMLLECSPLVDVITAAKTPWSEKLSGQFSSARNQTAIWCNGWLSKLAAVEIEAAKAEMSITKLQLLTCAFQLSKSKVIPDDLTIKQAVDRLLALGFSRCDYFVDLEARHCEILREKCQPEDRTFLEILRDGFNHGATCKFCPMLK